MIFFKGATMWELQVGRLYITVPLKRFRKTSKPKIYWLNKEGGFD